MLKAWEELVAKGEKVEFPTPWAHGFTLDWLALPPPLHDSDLRSVVYVSRDHLPIITRVDQLSSESAELLEALVAMRQAANAELVNKLKGVGKRDLSIMMEKLVGRGKQVNEWGTPPIL